jgi:drug/metabolite transporter (DMT)-like permease
VLRVTAGVQLICAVFLALCIRRNHAANDRPRWDAAPGFIGAGAFRLLHRSGIGLISVVSGMVAAYGGLTVVLSVLLRGETLTPVQALGATVATMGVIMTGVAFDGSLRGTRFHGPGVIFAVVALVLFAFMAITMDIALESADWIQVLLVSRLVIGFVSILAIGALAVAGRRKPSAPGGRLVPVRRVAVMLVIAGAPTPPGSVSFAIGSSNAPTWLVGLASSFGPP